VLVKEMQSLGLDVKVGYTNPAEHPAAKWPGDIWRL
jgi:hypothetical protein